MATWGDFQGYVDSRLERLTPEGRALVNQVLTARPEQVGPKLAGQAEAALAQQLGMKPEQAAGLLGLAMRTRQKPSENVESESGWQPFRTGGQYQQRATYASEEDYINDIYKAFGLEGEPTRAAGEAATAAEAPQRRDISAQIQTFVDSMLGPLDPNDPVRQSLVQAGSDAAQRSAGRAGLSGRSGLAGTQAASMAQQNIVPYEAQRKQLGLHGQQLLSQRDIQLGQLEAGATQLANEKAMAEWQAQQNQNQGIGAAIGGGIGALGFIGGPALGAATMGAGAALGGGLGGLASGGAAPRMQTARYGTQGSLGGRRGTNPYTGF